MNVASLICGFLGNLFLLLNFTQRIRYIIALPATILFWYLSSGFLIAITVCMDIYDPPSRPEEGCKYSVSHSSVKYFSLPNIEALSVYWYQPGILTVLFRFPRLLVRHRGSSILHHLLDDIDGQHAGLLFRTLPPELCAKRQSADAHSSDYGIFPLAWRRGCTILEDRARCRRGWLGFQRRGEYMAQTIVVASEGMRCF